jgi:hypothetical protein
MRALVVAVVAATALLGASAGPASAVRFAPAAHTDPEGDTAAPLDLRSATFGQQATRLQLQLRLARPWTASELDPGRGRSLCVTLAPWRGGPAVAPVCVGARAGHAVILRGDRVVDAVLARPDPQTIVASFSPLEARLRFGRYRWRAVAGWRNHRACLAGCSDLVPDHGPLPLTVGLLAEPRCFGAASRDPRRPCQSPALRTEVYPAPELAAIMPNAYCVPGRALRFATPCAFGASPARARASVALIGDSHAMHWRAALEVVAQAHRWRGLSVTRSSCPFSAALSSLKTYALSGQCLHWTEDVRQWLSRHPEIHTVFLAAFARAFFHGDPVAGYRAAIRGLPSNVHTVFVLRDTPSITGPQAGCVSRARAHHAPAGIACAQPRSANLPADGLATAARDLGGRAHVIDLTRFMCNGRLCLPVVGGALVRKDGGHLTQVFSTTLGPYVMRAVDAVLRGERP